MDSAAPAADPLHALELRVLEGPQRGARAPLPRSQTCTIAVGDGIDGDGADIVLREPNAAPTRLRVTADVPNAMLEVEHGQLQLGERTLSSGDQALWPAHAPLCMGTTVLAFGHAGIEAWPAGAPAARLDTAATCDTGAPAAVPLRRRAEVWLAALGLGVLLACGAAMSLTQVAAAPRPQTSVQAPALADALRTSEFSMLESGPGADGRPTLRGRLATQGQRQRLDAWIAVNGLDVAVDVLVDEAVLRDVTEVFRVNGVAVKAQMAGPGRVVAEAAERDHDRLARAEEVVRRDVRGFESLSLRNSAAPLPPPPAPPLPDNPGKRIASLVPGETAYLVTADGARYFLGALLPSGHRITQIERASVTLERDGQQSTLNF
jgi:type III secretion protein D